MLRSVINPVAASIILVMAVAGAVAQDVTLFGELMSDYETIRLALLHDSVDGVRESAMSMVRHLDEYDPESDTPPAAVKSESFEKFRSTVRDLRASAEKLGHEDTLGTFRDAFGELSRGMVAYRQMTENPKAVVAYCSMAEKVWLQPEGAIGNPYYGQSMAGCGEIVSK